MTIKKFIEGTIFGIGCTLCMIGGCALDSESLTIPVCLIGIGLMFGFLSYRGMMEGYDEIQNQ